MVAAICKKKRNASGEKLVQPLSVNERSEIEGLGAPFSFSVLQSVDCLSLTI
ncbi:MAG: hypothetical protein IT569_09805 [Leptospiraceae bacterium]|nr:hypothetical protein [Leptospiraceae bacterium]